MAESLAARVLLRFTDDEEKPSDAVVEDCVSEATDRLLMKLETESLPERAGSIVVRVAVKLLRLRGFEGSTSESAADGGSVSTSFESDVFAEFADEIAALKKTTAAGGIQFL